MPAKQALLPSFLRLDVAHNVLYTRVIVESVHRQVLAVARLLEATMRHLSHDWNVGVDPDAAKVKRLGHPHCPPVVLSPDA